MTFQLDRSKLDALIGAINDEKLATPQQYQNVSAAKTPIGLLGKPSNSNYVIPETETDPSFFSRVLDVLSRPLYGVQNVIKDTIDPNEGTQNPLESLWAGLSGIDKTTGRDVIQKMDDVYFDTQDVPDWVKGVGGLALDIGLDPTTYTTFGLGSLVKKSAGAASTALRGDKAYTEAIKAGEGAQEYTASELALKGEPAAKQAEKAAKKAEAEARAAATNAGRQNAVVDEVVHETATKPETNIAPLDDMSTPTPKPETVTPTAPRVLNDYAQAQKMQEITKQVFNDVKADPATAGMKYAERNQVVHEDIANRLRNLKEDSFKAGEYPVVPMGDSLYHVHVSDVYDSLGDAAKKFHLGNYDRVSPSSILHAGTAAVHYKLGGLTGDELTKAVAEAAQKANKTKTPLSATRAERLAKAIIPKTDEIEAKMVANEARMGKRDLVQGEALGMKTAEDTKAAVNDPTVPASDTLKSVADVNGKIVREGKAAGVSPGGQVVGAKRANQELSDTLAATDQAGARATLGAAKDATKGAKEKITNRQIKQSKADEAAIAAANVARYVDLGEHVANTIDTGIGRLYNGLLGGFTHGHRMGNTANIYRDQRAFAERVQQQYNDDLSALTKKYDRDTLNGAFVTRGVTPRPNDPNYGAMVGLRPLLEHMGLLTDDAADSAFVRSGLDVDTWNGVLKEVGAPQFQFVAKKGETMADVAKQVNKWQMTDDLTDSLSKIQSAIMRAETYKGVGNDFARNYRSLTPKPGYVKIAKTNYETAPLSHFIPDGYYPREYVEQIRRLNKMVITPTSSKNAFVKNVVDPYLRLWKPFNTIFRPGHHVRNFTGDGWMNFMAGVKNPLHYRNATAAQMAGRDLKIDYKTLKTVIKDAPAPSTKPLRHVKLNGSTVPINATDLWEAAVRNGTLVSFKSAEDILSSEGKNIIARGTDKIMESRPAKFAGKVSEGSTNMHKLAQLDYMLSDPKFTGRFKTLDEAVHEANKTILKYHPDIGGLAPLESKYGRRIIPFYTWMRQAVPVIMNQSLTKPGRLTAMPKAAYNFQVGMGMDPENLQEPFHNEGLLPSYVRESLSGNVDVGDSSYTFNTGSPAETLNDIFSKGEDANPVSTVGSFLGESLNPMLTILPESLKQQDVSGKHITDVSENIDQFLPGVGQLSNLTGVSWSGTAGNLLGGANTPVIDPQRKVLQGEKDNLDARTYLNFILGLQFQNVGAKSVEQFAVKENRN